MRKRSSWNLTMRLSDAGLRQRQTKAVYLNHRFPPWLTEDATRDRSNRLLDVRGANSTDEMSGAHRSPLFRDISATHEVLE